MINPAYHIIVTSLLTGASFLSLVFLLIRLWAEHSSKPHAHKYEFFADLALLICASVMFVFMTTAIATGFLIWPLEAVLNSALLKNKLTLITIQVLVWGTFLAHRFRNGPRLWNNHILSGFSMLLVLLGFITNLLVNSIGGEVAGNGSGFERLIQLFGIETRFTFYLPAWLLAVIVALAGIGFWVGRCFPQAVSRKK